MKKLMFLVTLLFFTFAMFSCGSNDKVMGTYYFQSISVGSNSYKVGDSFANHKLVKDDIKLVIAKNEFVITFDKAISEVSSEKGIWKKVDNNYELTASNGTKYTLVLEDSKVTISPTDDSTIKYVLVK